MNGGMLEVSCLVVIVVSAGASQSVRCMPMDKIAVA
jgi:hypothetical protein